MPQLEVLNFVNKVLQPEVRSRIEEYVRERKTRGPLIVEFDPTTACNFQCPECISLGLLNKGQISPGRTLELINEFHNAGVKGIIFIGGGEPLAHTGMPQPIIYAHELGMQIGLTTNGSLIKRHLGAIAECVDWTRVSIDAAKQKTFSLFRPSGIPNSFANVISNVEALAKVKTGILGYSFLLIERVETDGSLVTNCDEIFEAASLARDIGCDYFEFKPCVDEHHCLIPFSQHMRAVVHEHLEKVRSLNTSEFCIIYPKSIDHLLYGGSPEQPKTYTTCPTLELRTVLTPSGIYPCPYKRGIRETLIGSSNEPFDRYWQSEERQKRTRKVNPSTDCRFYCIRHDSNILLNMLAQSYSDGIDLLPYLIGTSAGGDIFI
jgi:MoaA/NifB/PqqE/SkfB family radical SAM enzyme